MACQVERRLQILVFFLNVASIGQLNSQLTFAYSFVKFLMVASIYLTPLCIVFFWTIDYIKKRKYLIKITFTYENKNNTKVDDRVSSCICLLNVRSPKNRNILVNHPNEVKLCSHSLFVGRDFHAKIHITICCVSHGSVVSAPWTDSPDSVTGGPNWKNRVEMRPNLESAPYLLRDRHVQKLTSKRYA